MNILVIGSGAREHALAWKLFQSPRMPKIFAVPGNDGMRPLAEPISVDWRDAEAVARLALNAKIDLVVVGPDDALALGLVDELQKHCIPTFGPTRAAAEIEWSKVFAKELMDAERIPTAQWAAFASTRALKRYVRNAQMPLMLKLDGLARGKGVLEQKRPENVQMTLKKIETIPHLKVAARRILLEAKLEGREVSIHALCDGSNALLFEPSRDYKTLYPGGPNTGGMGGYAPAEDFCPLDMLFVQKNIIERTLETLRERGRPFVGCLYPGLMITDQGPKVLEFNARFGDPEAQLYMRLLKSDLAELMEACVAGRLAGHTLEWHRGYAVCVVLASRGYGITEEPEIGKLITGLDEAKKIPGVEIFYAGVRWGLGGFYTAGGRVMSVTAVGDTLRQARGRAYKAANLIEFDGKQVREDIADETKS